MMANRWQADLYDSRHGFVSRYGADLLHLLDAQPGEHILDLGCGTGHLTQQIAEAGAHVIGIDSAAAMIEQAQASYPTLDFRVINAESFYLDTRFDAVFSNAALHWMTNAEAVVANVHQVLRPGGRFVGELGGRGNIRHIYTALGAVLAEAGYPPLASPWYFPALGEYATLLESVGFRVIFAAHFDRPTPLDGPDGLMNWLKMFANSLLPDGDQSALLKVVEDRLRPVLYQDGVWTADYVRLRFVALKE